MEAIERRPQPLRMDHEEEEDVDDPQQDSGSIRSTESEGAIEQSSGSPSSEVSAKLDDETGEVFQDNSNTDDNTDVDDERRHGPQSEIRDGEFQFQVKSFHIVNARQGKKQFKCDVCTGTYQHAFSLKRHFLRTHVNYKYLSEADITNCNINLNLVRQLREESDSSSPDASSGEAKSLGLYRCHLCSKLFDVREELKIHVGSHADDNGQKNFSCSQCEMTFSHRQNLVRHQSVHSGERQFVCKHCDKSFPTLANQRRHEKIHESSDLPFPCSFCAASFAHGVRLQKHLRKHHPEHYYPCELCPKFFLEEEQLKKHTATHKPTEGSTSKKCKLPEARVVFKARKRAKGFESENKYLCSICKRRFATYITLCRHKKAAHAAAQQEKRTRSLQPRSEPVVVRSRSSKPVVKEMPEEEFYMTIAHRISENLLYHLDGKSSQLKIKQDQCAFPEEKNPKVTMQYSLHNFPAAFDITQMMQIYSNRTPSGNNTVSNDGSDNSEETECIFLGGSRQDRSWSHKANGVAGARPHKPGENVIGRNVPLTFICSVCAEKFSSKKAIEEHKINNHPNVVCTHIEIEGEKEVPPELCWSLRSPVGFLCSSPAAAPVTAPVTGNPGENLACTKCRSTFLSRDDLHQHILDCGANSGFHKQLTRGHSVHSRLGCSARQLSVPVREGPVKAKKRPLVNESPSAEARRAKRGACSPRNEEKALDLKVRPRASTPPKFNPDPVVLETDQSLEEQREVVQEAEAAPAEKTADDSVAASESGEGKDKKMSHEAVDRGTAVVEDAKEVEDTAALQPSESAQQSSPNKLVGNEVDNRTGSPPLVEKKASAESPSAAEASPKEETATSPREQSCEEVKTDADQCELAESEQAPSPVLGEGRRVLRSKTAAVSARGGVSSSAVVNPHMCSTCQRSFTYAASLKKHLRDICPNLKEGGEKVVKKRKAGKMSKKEDPASEAQVHAGSLPDDVEVKKERLDVASSPSLLNMAIFPGEADTSGLELLANASSMERPVPSAAGGLSWAAGNSSTTKQAASSELKKEGESSRVLAPGKLKGKEETVDPSSELGEVDIKPDLRPQNREHTCPYCLHSFAYLSNYRKHLREVCLIKKKREKKNGDGSEPAPSARAPDDSHSLVDRADNSATITMSFKGRIENSVINLLRNQSKQVELIGAQAAAVKDQPGGANHSSPNFMTFSCPVCHKIFLSYVKMLQHRLSHKLQTDEPVVKQEKTDVTDTAGSQDVGAPSVDESTRAAVGRSEDAKPPVLSVPIKTEEDQRFDEVLTGKRASEASDAENASVREELKREEHNYAAVSLAELDSLPEDDAEADDAAIEETAPTVKPKVEPPPEHSTETKAKAALPAKKSSLGKKSSEIATGNKLPLPKEKVRRGMRRLSVRTTKAASRDKQ